MHFKKKPQVPQRSFLGIELDAVNMVTRVLQDKLNSFLKTTHSCFLCQQKGNSHFEVFQSLIGLLNFACRMVVPGIHCSFLSTSHDTTKADQIFYQKRSYDLGTISRKFQQRFGYCFSHIDLYLYTESTVGPGGGFGTCW
jgi:hypothetical protein